MTQISACQPFLMIFVSYGVDIISSIQKAV